jgi:putative endonuclease
MLSATNRQYTDDMDYVVYLVECGDGTFYTGCTNNIEQRLYAHNHLAAGSRYTRSRRPVALKYVEPCANKSEALQREAALKKLTRQQKMMLINQAHAGERDLSTI